MRTFYFYGDNSHFYYFSSLSIRAFSSMILSIIWPKKFFIQVSSLTPHKLLKKENFYCWVNENY
jgi:hypothetical protein